MNFNQALDALRNGYVVTRPNLSYVIARSLDKSSHYIYLGVGNENSCIKKVTTDAEYFLSLSNNQVALVGYTFSSEDKSSTNWEITSPVGSEND